MTLLSCSPDTTKDLKLRLKPGGGVYRLVNARGSHGA